jgi:hypothetical protein
MASASASSAAAAKNQSHSRRQVRHRYTLESSRTSTRRDANVALIGSTWIERQNGQPARQGNTMFEDINRAVNSRKNND